MIFCNISIVADHKSSSVSRTPAGGGTSSEETPAGKTTPGRQQGRRSSLSRRKTKAGDSESSSQDEEATAVDTPGRRSRGRQSVAVPKLTTVKEVPNSPTHSELSPPAGKQHSKLAKPVDDVADEFARPISPQKSATMSGRGKRVSRAKKDEEEDAEKSLVAEEEPKTGRKGRPKASSKASSVSSDLSEDAASDMDISRTGSSGNRGNRTKRRNARGKDGSSVGGTPAKVRRSAVSSEEEVEVSDASTSINDSLLVSEDLKKKQSTAGTGKKNPTSEKKKVS